MTLPVITVYPDAIPSKGQAQTAFDTNVNDYLTWQVTFATQLTPWITQANALGAALVAGNLPPLTGRQLDAVRVNAAANGVEFVDVTAAGWALLDDANAAAQRATLGLGTAATTAAIPEQTQTVFNAGTDTTESTITAAKLDAKVRDELNATGAAPMFACRAWVNFNGTGTVAIRASGNVSSITDNGIGDYTVNFTTAMQDVNYAVLGTGSDASGTASIVYKRRPDLTPNLVGSCRVTAANPGVGPMDPVQMNLAFFR